MINWQKIDTVLLDMDGTLLDLNFDNHFWQEHVPQRYAEKHNMDKASAKEVLFPKFRSVEGTMDWYCVDYWTRELGLDIALLKEEINHLIDIHPHVPEFLESIRNANKQLILVTNAHMKSLSLKMEKTQLAGHFDKVICAHDYGLPKEKPDFWGKLKVDVPFKKTSTLLIDDSLPVLRSARTYGIEYLLAVHKPDTQQPPKDVEEFNAVKNFYDLFIR